jgi:hypothetical protein
MLTAFKEKGARQKYSSLKSSFFIPPFKVEYIAKSFSRVKLSKPIRSTKTHTYWSFVIGHSSLGLTFDRQPVYFLCLAKAAYHYKISSWPPFFGH